MRTYHGYRNSELQKVSRTSRWKAASSHLGTRCFCHSPSHFVVSSTESNSESLISRFQRFVLKTSVAKVMQFIGISGHANGVTVICVSRPVTRVAPYTCVPIKMAASDMCIPSGVPNEHFFWIHLLLTYTICGHQLRHFWLIFNYPGK